MKELSKKKYVTLITIMILVLGIIGIVNIGNTDLDKGKVKLKSASIEKLKSSVIESKGYEEITYPVLYELEKVEGIEERNVIIKGTLTKEENKYARFKEITSKTITSTVSENGREIEIRIEKVKLGRQNKINIKIEINGAINETKIKPEIEIKEESEKEYTKVNTEEIEVKTNSVTGLVQDEEGMSVSNLELSINKGNEEIRRTYTDENGRYVFSDVEEGKYTIKVEEESYELKEIKEVEVIGGITENIIVKKIKPYEIEVKKYISKIKLNNNGKEIEYEYGKLNKVNQTVKNLKNLSGEIEYKIEIKNTGEKSGEITKIEEEVTEGLKFNKEKNSEWEEKNGKIINRSLEGIKLKAGEEKEITLKLDIEKTDEARSYLQKVTAKGEVYQNVVYILGGKEYRKEKVLEGEKIEEPKIVQENFKGWYTDKKYTNKYNFNNDVTKDIILYGKVEESTKKYIVQYIDEGKIIKEEELEEGSIVNAPEVTKEGHTFIGWYEGKEKYDVYEPITRNLILESKYEINKYKVRFINEDGSVLQEETLDYGSTPTYKKETPTKKRTEEYTYEFDKWMPEITKVTGNQEYKATYKETKNKYTVTYINEGKEYHKETALYGNTIKNVENPTKEGYTFIGWYDINDKKVNHPITVTKNMTLYSKYEINSYKISYYNEGVKYIEDQKINYGENALKPNTNPSKIGYTFKYWSLKENGEEYEFSTKITKDITLYAVYEINKYTVTYINEGIEYHKETAEYGSVITSIQDPTKEGYTFTGWYTKDNEKISYPITVTENITLYSKYEINSYKVSYYNEGKKYIDDQKINYGENALKPNTNPSKIGYTFKYWSIKENGEEYEFSTKITKDINLYAVYEINKYTVTYINEGIEYHKETAEYGSVITSIQDPTKEGYTFVGWYNENNEKVIHPITVTENITLHSKYKINTYTVSFYHNNEKYVEDQKINYGESAVKPSIDPTKEDYNFSGWVIKGTNNKYDFTSKVTKDIELESSFTAKPTYTVTFKIGNEVILTENVIEGHKVTSKEAPYKKGYLFDKWYSDEGLTIENNFNEKIMGNKIIYGKYNENKHTVTYINEGTTYYTEKVLDRFTAKGPNTNPEKEGYTFKYFSKDKKVAFDYNAEITEDTTLYAVYEINKYTVTYINEGSEYHKEELTYKSKHEKIEDPFKTGYTFIGWYNENEEKVEYPITVTKDITLHSKYEINKYIVTFNDEDRITTKEVNYNAKVEPVTNQGKTGYTFKYWSIEKGGEEYNFNTLVTENITLYAVYNINKYTVTFKNYDGSTLQEETLEYRALPKYKGEAPKREKTKEYTYTFKGWDKEITEVTNNQEYIATYTETKNKYNVKFTNYDGSILQEEALEYGTLPVYKGEVPTREKTEEYTYTFKNWNKEITEVTDNEIYIATYTETKNKYTVIYMDGETEYTRKEVNYGETVSEEVINKDHNIYRGWMLEGNIYDFNTPVTKNITIKSSFELVESPIIESTPIEWTKENVRVTITTNHNDYSYMYKIDDGEYQNYNGEFTVDKNCTVIAKSIKENVESEVTTKEITNIDKVLPVIKEITEENITTKSFDIKVKGQDNESGLSEIRIYKNEELMVSYPYTERLNEEKEETYSLTGLEENTTYKIKVELIDKVGNINVSEEKEITTLKRVIVSRIIGRNNSLYESEAEYELFESLEEAITACGSNECTIEMVIDTKESVNVLEGQEIKLELNGKTVTGVRDYTIENSGELIIDNDQEIGSITNTNGIGIKNIANGILQIGENEEPLSVSTTKPNIVGTTYGIYTEEETAKLKFYDGKIEGNVAIQGNVDDTPYLYNAKITNEGHQVATLSILAEAEAKITGGKYYTKLTNAVSETKIGTYKTEEQDIMSNFITPGLYGFDYDEETKSLISNNAKIRGSSANSYIKLDLTDYEYDQELTIDSLVSTYRHYGYVTITKSKTIPSANNTDGRIIYITAENSANSAQATTVLEKGNVYYLHLGYAKSSSYNDYTNNEDVFKITNIKINNHIENNLDLSKDLITPGEYGFTYSDGVLKSNNQNKDNTTANSYIKVDLTNYLDDKEFFINATVSSERNNDIGYITITDSETIPSYNSTTGRVVYISGDTSGIYKATLTAGKINYIHLGYRKDGSANTGTDTFTINKIYTVTRGETSTNVIAKVPILNENVDTVELIKDVTLSSPIEVASTKEMIIDLNGKTLTTTANDYVIKNSGDLTIIDSKYSSDVEKNQADYDAEQAKNLSKYNEQLANYEKIYSDVKESCPEVEEFKIEAESTNIVSGNPNWSNSSFSGGHGVDYAYDLNFEYDSKNIGEKKLKIFGSYLSRNTKIYLDDTEIYSGAFGTSSNYGNFEISLGNLEKRKYTIRFTSVNGNYAPIYDYFEVSDSTTFKCDAFNESDVSMDNFKFIDSNNSSNIWNSYYNTQYNGVIYYLKKVIVNEGEVYTAKGDLAVYNSTSNVTTDIYVGFSSSKEINKDDFVSYKLIKAQSNSSSLENYMISIDEPGEYYFKIVIDKSSTNRFTSYLKIDNIKFKMHPELQQAVLKEATYTGIITSTTNSIIYNNLNANLTIKEAILNLNKSGEYNAITNEGTLSILNDAQINLNQQKNRGIYNGYNANIKDGGGTINLNSSGYGIYNVSKVDDGFNNITFNLSNSSAYAFYNKINNITVDNIKTTGYNSYAFNTEKDIIINNSVINSQISIRNISVELNNSTHSTKTNYDSIYDGTLKMNNSTLYFNSSRSITGSGNIEFNDSNVYVQSISQSSDAFYAKEVIINNSNISNTSSGSYARLFNSNDIYVKGNSTITSTSTAGQVTLLKGSNIYITDNVTIDSQTNDYFIIDGEIVTIGDKDGNVSSNIYIESNKAKSTVKANNLYLYDGVIKGKKENAIKGGIKEIEDGYDIGITEDGDYEIISLTKPTEAVAQIGEKNYTSLKTAIDEVQSGETIKLIKNVYTIDQYVINKDFNIDLNKNTIRSFNTDWLFKNSSVFKIYDSNSDSRGKIHNSNGLLFYNEGTTNINNIDIYSRNPGYYSYQDFNENDVFDNLGTLNLENVSVDNSIGVATGLNNYANAKTTISNSKYSGALTNNGDLTIDSTEITGNESRKITNTSNELTIKNSTVNSIVNNIGVFTSLNNNFNSNVTNNSSGTFTSSSDSYKAKLENSGLFDLTDVTLIKNYSFTNLSGIMNINSGTINGSIINSSTGTINIYGGNINSGVSNRGTGIINIIGGIFNTNSQTIVNSSTGTINIGTKDGIVNIDSPMISTTTTNTSYAAVTNTRGTLNFYDGTIKGIMVISGKVNETEDGYDIVTKNEDNLEIKYLAKEYAVQIESTGEKYYSLNDAINAVSTDNEIITLLRDLTVLPNDESAIIPENKNITFDLNGKTISQNNEPLLVNNGTFTLKDSADTIEDKNSYTMYSGTIKTNVGNIIENNGTFNYDSGTITSSQSVSNLITNNGVMNMNGGYINPSSRSSNLIINNNKLLINNGTIYADGTKNAVYNKIDATLTINNAIFNVELSESNVTTSAIMNEGITYINGGSYTIRSNYYHKIPVYLYNETNANAVIKGLDNFKGDILYSVYNKGNVEISNSTIYNGKLYNQSGTMNLTNVVSNYSTSSSQVNSNGVINFGTGIININSGSYDVPIENTNSGIINIKSGTYTRGVKNTSTGTINIGTKGDLTEEGELNVSKTNPDITSDTYGLEITSGTVNFYDGIISGTTDAVNGTINEIEDGYEIISGTTEDSKKSKYLSKLPLAQIESTGDTYYTLQEAIDSVTKTGETIKLIRNYTTLASLETTSISTDKNITIDLNGYMLEQNNEKFLINNGTLTITDSSENSTNKIEMYADKLLENNGTLILNSLNIDIKSRITNVIDNKSSLSIINSKIQNASNGGGSYVFASNAGTLTLENTTIDFNRSSSDTTVINNGTLNVIGGNYKIFNGTLFRNNSIVNIKDGTYTFTYWYESYYSAYLLYSTSNEDMTIDSMTVSSPNNGTKATSIYNAGTSNTVNVINSNDQAVTNNASTGTMIITGGTLAGVNNSGTMTVSNSTIGGIGNGNGTLDIKESTLSSISNAGSGTTNVHSATVNGAIDSKYGGTLNIYDINLTGGGTVYSGTINIYGGTITSTTGNSITNTGTVNIGSKDGNVSTEMPVITGKTYGVSNSGSGKVNFYDGIVSGESGAFYGTINEVEPGYKIVTNKTDTLTSATLTLVGDDEKVAVLNGINFTSLQDAINSASDTNESIITLYKDVTFESNITVPANKNIKLYLNGYTLNKVSYDFTGEGKITVIDGTSTNALANIMESVKEVLNIEGIKKNIIIYEMDDGSAISSESTYKLYKDNEEVMLEEDAIGIYSVGNSNDEIRSANNKIYINELPKGKYKLIGDNNKEVKFEIDESGKIIGNVKENTKETRKLVSTAVAELIIMIQTGIEKVNYIMIILTLLVTISSLLYIVKKTNVKES